jgi:hypothetical protein
MATFLTEQDLRSEYVAAMGPDLGSLCHDLRKEVDWLQDKWSMFRELFSRGSERLDLLNTVASNFFYSLQSGPTRSRRRCTGRRLAQAS